MTVAKQKYIFGGDLQWQSSEWTDSDDRVRGGSSQSNLSLSEDGKTARFHGNLDTETLGGAGFASQRTTAEHKTWDLAEYEGIELSISDADSMRYTITLKTALPSRRSDGRDAASISYEYDFTVTPDSTSSPASDSATATKSKKPYKIAIPFTSFKATYRGKPAEDADELDPGSIRRFSLMTRSFFDRQSGRFSLSVRSITAVKIANEDRSGGVSGCNTDSLDSDLKASDDVQVDEKRALMERDAQAGQAWTPTKEERERERRGWNEPDDTSAAAAAAHRRGLVKAFAHTLLLSGLVLLGVYATVFARYGCPASRASA